MKYYNIEVILYSEEEYKRILTIIKDTMQWASIIHDKDIDEKGEKVGTHRHLQIYSKIQKSISSWSKFLEIKENMIQTIRYKPSAIQYLIHKNNPEKYQYNKKDIESNFNINAYFKEEEKETGELKILIEFIEITRDIKMSELLNYALNNNIWSTYRRNYTILKDYIYEKKELTQKKINDILEV